MTHEKELAVAKAIALKAGDIMLEYFDQDQQEHAKDDGTAVTIADTQINRVVIEELGKAFPQDGVIGEEESTAEYGSGRRWICDPIDGTAAYTVGLPSSMFSLCLVIDGKPMVAVAYEPHRKQLYTALRGEGSYCNSKQLRVSQENITTGHISIAADLIRPKYISESWMQHLLAYDKQLIIFPGAVFRSCRVASGRIAGFPHPNVKPYDIAAAHLIVEEAGGKVTDIAGRPLDYSTEFRGAIVSNGVVHDDLLALFS